MTVAVYFVRAGDNPELRYSLRSLDAHVDDITDVVIVGHAEPWLRNVTVIPGNPHGTAKWRNVWANVRIAAEHPDLPDDIVYLNDDFYAVRPADTRMTWRCTLDQHIATLPPSPWRRSLEVTRRHFRRAGHDTTNLLSYELHRPFPANRARMAQALAEAADIDPHNPPQWRTVYGNRWDVGGTQAPDGKVYNRDEPLPATPWVSSTDGAVFDRLHPMLDHLFRHPSRWEHP